MKLFLDQASEGLVLAWATRLQSTSDAHYIVVIIVQPLFVQLTMNTQQPLVDTKILMLYLPTSFCPHLLHQNRSLRERSFSLIAGELVS